MEARGHVFKYGDNVDTDVIIPARYLNSFDPQELASHAMADIDPEFAKKVQAGDLIVAKKNFGCGSSREHAPLCLKTAGVSCVIAETFARIFYRNAINIGLPIIECPQAAQEIEAGDEVEVGCAFAAPSANLSGKPSPTNAQDVFTDMDGRLPLILDGGECDWGVESTVVSVVGEKPTLFRPGHITLEDLERALGEEVEVSKAILEKLPEGAVVRSPGMKYKHYAPKADVTLLDGTFEQFKAYVDAHAEQNPSCLCFTGETEKLGVPCVEYGREGDGADQAKHIFRCLRALDEQGDAVVYARCPQKDGLSMAVYNRLIRAAAFRVIKL